MGKKLFILALLVLSSCEKNEPTENFIQNASFPKFSYNNIVGWDKIFSFSEENYFVYVFSYTCYHCNLIKDDILLFQEHYPLYCVEYNSSIPITYYIDNTIGLTSTKGLSIKGTPTLIEIKNNILVKNYAGSNEIKNIISILLNRK